jgi:hypothetical protein
LISSLYSVRPSDLARAQDRFVTTVERAGARRAEAQAAAQAAYAATLERAREDRRATFREAHETMSIREIAAASGLSPTRVAQILRGE